MFCFVFKWKILHVYTFSESTPPPNLMFKDEVEKGFLKLCGHPTARSDEAYCQLNNGNLYKGVLTTTVVPYMELNVYKHITKINAQ